MGDLVPRKELTKQGVQGVGGVGGGILLLVLSAGGIGAAIVGGLIAIAGLAMSRSKDREDRVPGYVVTAAGALGVLSIIPGLGGVAGTLLTISGIGLLALGGWKLIKFIMNLRKRT